MVCLEQHSLGKGSLLVQCLVVFVRLPHQPSAERPQFRSLRSPVVNGGEGGHSETHQ